MPSFNIRLLFFPLKLAPNLNSYSIYTNTLKNPELWPEIQLISSHNRMHFKGLQMSHYQNHLPLFSLRPHVTHYHCPIPLLHLFLWVFQEPHLPPLIHRVGRTQKCSSSKHGTQLQPWWSPKMKMKMQNGAKD